MSREGIRPEPAQPVGPRGRVEGGQQSGGPPSNARRTSGVEVARSLLLPAVSAIARLASVLAGDGGGGGAQDRGPGRGPMPHSRPREECPLPISGYPFYLAGLTIGTPIADFGSHGGLKAATRPAGGATGRDLLEVAHYAAFRSIAARVDRSRLRFEGAGLERRDIRFYPWGFVERARDRDGDAAALVAEGRVATVATDAFVLAASLQNRGPAAVTFVPALEVLEDDDPVHEGMQPLHLSLAKRWRAAFDPLANVLRVDFRRGLGLPFLDFDGMRFCRAFHPSFRGARFTSKDGAGGFQARLAGAEVPVPAGGRVEVVVHLGIGETPDEADTALARALAAEARRQRLVSVPRIRSETAESSASTSTSTSASDGRAESGPSEGEIPHLLRPTEDVESDWEAFLASLPSPHAEGREARRVLELAAAGLRMNVYAPRGRLPRRASVPAKVHFNGIWGWDSAFGAIGASELDPALAKDVLASLFAGQRPEGHLCYAVDPATLAPVAPLIGDLTMPPAQGYALAILARRDPVRDEAWLEEMYERSKAYVAWFDAERRIAGSSLFRYANAIESGWDDTPRIPSPRVPAIRAPVKLDLANLCGLRPAPPGLAALDLAAWLHAYHAWLADAARDLGRPAAEEKRFRDRAAAIAADVDALLWDDETGAYLDRDLGRRAAPGGGGFVRTLTPVCVWPLFLGLCRDPARARRLVETHVANPRTLFGDPDDAAAPRYPVPTVAYSDPAFDRERDGYYWRGQIWMITAYATLVALFRYGYEREATALKARLLRLLAGCDGGLFETYDPATGEVGFGSGCLAGPGEPAAFQIGLTTSFVLEMLLDRHERDRFLLPGDAGFTGFVAEARRLPAGDLFYRVEPARGDDVPRTRLAHLEDGGVSVHLDDPYGSFGQATARIALPTMGVATEVQLGETRIFRAGGPPEGTRAEATNESPSPSASTTPSPSPSASPEPV